MGKKGIGRWCFGNQLHFVNNEEGDGEFGMGGFHADVADGGVGSFLLTFSSQGIIITCGKSGFFQLVGTLKKFQH